MDVGVVRWANIRLVLDKAAAMAVQLASTRVRPPLAVSPAPRVNIQVLAPGVVQAAIRDSIKLVLGKAVVTFAL